MRLEEVIKKRRSIRLFEAEPFPEEQVQKALELALLAPNSSNTQTWNFYWVQSPDKKQQLIDACLGQSAARTASHLIVATADPKLWRRSQSRLIEWVTEVGAPKSVLAYYQKIVPMMYRWGFLNTLGLIKKLTFWLIGCFRPIMRGPCLRHEQETVALKSVALACQTFVLAIEALGGASCMMEGFDETRVKKLLRLSSTERVAMVIAVGFKNEKGEWGPRSRLPTGEVIHRV